MIKMRNSRTIQENVLIFASVTTKGYGFDKLVNERHSCCVKGKHKTRASWEEALWKFTKFIILSISCTIPRRGELNKIKYCVIPILKMVDFMPCQWGAIKRRPQNHFTPLKTAFKISDISNRKPGFLLSATGFWNPERVYKKNVNLLCNVYDKGLHCLFARTVLTPNTSQLIVKGEKHSRFPNLIYLVCLEI